MDGIRSTKDGYKVTVYDHGFVTLCEIKDGRFQDCVFDTKEEAQRARDAYYNFHANK